MNLSHPFFTKRSHIIIECHHDHIFFITQVIMMSTLSASTSQYHRTNNHYKVVEIPHIHFYSPLSLSRENELTTNICNRTVSPRQPSIVLWWHRTITRTTRIKSVLRVRRRHRRVREDVGSLLVSTWSEWRWWKSTICPSPSSWVRRTCSSGTSWNEPTFSWKAWFPPEVNLWTADSWRIFSATRTWWVTVDSDEINFP